MANYFIEGAEPKDQDSKERSLQKINSLLYNAVDEAGKIQIGGVALDALELNTDQVESKLDTTNAILTTTAADVAAVKTQLATGTIAVTGGGGGGSGASAAYNATLPTYTSGASTTLQTDVNGRLITTGPELQTISTEAVAIDAKLPSLSSGRVPVEAANAASQSYSFTQSGAVAVSTVLIGPIDCSQFREITLSIVALGAGMQVVGQFSPDGTNWAAAVSQRLSDGTTNSNQISGVAKVSYPAFEKFFRVINNTAQTSGTTTLVAYASQQATPKLYQSVTGSVSVTGQVTTTALPNPATMVTNSVGFSTYHTLVSAASTNATNVKSSSGMIGSCSLTNTSASWRYFKLFNLSTSPIPGTSTPILNFGIPPNDTRDLPSSFAGMRLSAGISYAITSGSALLDTGAVGAGEVLVNLSFA